MYVVCVTKQTHFRIEKVLKTTNGTDMNIFKRMKWILLNPFIVIISLSFHVTNDKSKINKKLGHLISAMLILTIPDFSYISLKWGEWFFFSLILSISLSVSHFLYKIVLSLH